MQRPAARLACYAPVCMAPVCVTPVRIIERPVIVRRIKFVDVVREPVSPISESEASSSDSEEASHDRGKSSISAKRAPVRRKKKVTSKPKKASREPGGGSKEIDRAKPGETAVRISGGYRAYGRDEMYRGKGMGMDERFEEERSDNARSRGGGSSRGGGGGQGDRRQQYNDEALDYRRPEDAARRPGGYPPQSYGHGSCCCCCCCCDAPRSRSRRSHQGNLNLGLLAGDLSYMTDDALTELALTASFALAHAGDDTRASREKPSSNQSASDFEQRISAFRSKYNV